MADSGHSAQVLQSWSTAYDACYRLYEYDKREECIDVAESHLRDASMPLYHRMLFELILGGCLGCWYEAGDAVARCEGIWHNTHTYHKDDTDELVQDSLAEIRQFLDGMQREHAMKPRAMEDPRLEGYEEDEEDQDGQDDEDDDMGVAQWYVVDEDWESEEEPMVELSVSAAIGETMEVDGVKPGLERIPSDIVEVDADAKHNVPSGFVEVEDDDAKPAAVEEPSLKAAEVEEPLLKAVESEVDMMGEQSQPPVGSAVDGGAWKKPLLASRLLKKTKSTKGMGMKGKDISDKEIRKKGSMMDLAPRSALKSALDLLHFHGRQERRPGATQ
jgi:hypothetical protein